MPEPVLGTGDTAVIKKFFITEFILVGKDDKLVIYAMKKNNTVKGDGSGRGRRNVSVQKQIHYGRSQLLK